jgi:hypothetical protein
VRSGNQLGQLFDIKARLNCLAMRGKILCLRKSNHDISYLSKRLS